MNTYISRYPKGFFTVVDKILKSVISDAKILYKDETLIAYETKSSWTAISKLTFFETSFSLIALFDDPRHHQLRDMLRWAKHNSVFYKRIRKQSHRNTTFRIVGSKADFDKRRYQKEIQQLEHFLQSRYGVQIDRGRPRFEIRFVEKKKVGFIGIRVAQSPHVRSKQERGSLREVIASYLVFMSEPNSKDVFLDPFAGGGMIPIHRAKYYKYKEIIASDKSLNKLRPKLRREQQHFDNFTVIESDIKELPTKLQLTVNKIVTDPPWGFMENVNDEENFYLEMFTIFQEILEKDGLIVLLSTKEELIDGILQGNEIYFKLIKKLEVEVSGRKSFVYKVKKI